MFVCRDSGVFRSAKLPYGLQKRAFCKTLEGASEYGMFSSKDRRTVFCICMSPEPVVDVSYCIETSDCSIYQRVGRVSITLQGFGVCQD